MDITTTSEDSQFVAEVAAESIGWQPLGDGGYLHVGESDVLAINVVGADAG